MKKGRLKDGSDLSCFYHKLRTWFHSLRWGQWREKQLQGLGVNVFSFEEVGFDFPGKDNDTVTKRLLAL